MAHVQQAEFCLSVRNAFPVYFSERIVVDIGSLDINGNNQFLFSNCLYLGVDVAPGRNVDFVSPGHALGLPDGSIDTVVSTECFEHDQYYEQTLKNIVRLLKPGGMFLFSCATTGRPEHGTRRTTPHDAPLIQGLGEWSDYYKNLEERDIREVINIDAVFSHYAFSVNDETHDLYFWGIKSGKASSRSDYSFQIQRSALQAELEKMQGHAASLQKTITERDQTITALNASLLKRDEYITSLSERLREAEGKLSTQSLAFEEATKEIQLQASAAKESNAVMAQDLASSQARLQQIYQSLSWRLTKPVRFTGRIARGEFGLVKSGVMTHLRISSDSSSTKEAVEQNQGHRSAKLYAAGRRIYHALPLAPSNKMKLRRVVSPFLRAAMDVSDGKSVSTVMAALKEGKGQLEWGGRREAALDVALRELSTNATAFGPVSHVIVLPFLATGGAERVALNYAQSIRNAHPELSVLLVIADRDLVSNRVEVPAGVGMLVLDKCFETETSYAEKQQLLEDLLTALRPLVTHNINSEVAWNLYLSKGDRLSRMTRLYASIFAFQFAPDGKSKIGYAAYFLQPGIRHLTGLLSDNKRFIEDAAKEYRLSGEDQSKMRAVYNPVRVDRSRLSPDIHARLAEIAGRQGDRRLKVLWAGRLDEEKRIDLLFELIKNCEFADFDVYGSRVMTQDSTLPQFSNLQYKGAFSTPEELVDGIVYDAFIFTSRWEGLPNILLEVGALGVPVVAPTVGGVGELVTHSTGYPLPEQPAIADYVDALKKIQSDPLDASSKAQNLLRLIEERHSWTAFEAATKEIPEYLDKDDRKNA
jgi:glycosyltransferase involved in cell wall biosynthesis/SAM-dependent methyltransferase